MFRVEVFVDDKKLSQLLHALTGVVIGEPKVQPVVNGTVKKGKAVAANSGDPVELFRDYVRGHELTEIDASVMKAFAKFNGKSVNSYSHYIDKFKAAGILKKKTKRGNGVVYSVVAK